MKKYNISNKSDMRRFQHDIESKVMGIAEQAVYSRGYEVTCSHCHKKSGHKARSWNLSCLSKTHQFKIEYHIYTLTLIFLEASSSANELASFNSL